MAADIGELFNVGPEVVANAAFEEGLDFQDLGGPMMHCTNGTTDNLAANEAECFEQLRTVLRSLPNHGGEAPPVVKCEDPVKYFYLLFSEASGFWGFVGSQLVSLPRYAYLFKR
jgi:acetyl-CoA carboxylase carboxyltransferase component